ncbi:MAG: thioesterase family protein [Crenarchaeota archaeon]|nr:thioesterase family protein [Thermoproteota archaeon]
MSAPSIPVGETHAKKFLVTEEHTAKHIGSGEVEVLSTPSMILFMESTALELAQKHLPQHMTTVGVRVDVKHMNPVPVGEEVEVTAKLVKQEGRKLVFEVRATWKDLTIGEGVHERYIVDREKFAAKVRKLIEERRRG